MKKRLLFFAVLLSCLILISSIPICASAAELYSSSYPKAWYARTSSNYPYVAHYDSNVFSTYGVYISGGYSIWNNSGRASNYSISSSSSTSYRIYHMVPTLTWWQNILSSNAQFVQAITYPYDTNGTQITSGNYATTTSSIRSATVYYQPTGTGYNSFNNLSNTEKYCVIAHEIGHALGFGHYDGTTSSGSYASIMNSLQDRSFTALTNYDYACLITKYPLIGGTKSS